jgi:hypothetical protein
LDFYRYQSSRWIGHPSRFQDSVGGCSARRFLPRRVHLVAGDFNNMIHFYKNLVMAGGFLYVMAYGAGAMSIDGVDEA